MKNATAVSVTSGRARVVASIDAGILHLRFSGVLNENTDYGEISNLVLPLVGQTSRVLFYVAEITAMNSVGIRGWFPLNDKIQAAAACEFAMVGEVFAEHAGLLPKLLGKEGTPIRAFDAPFICERCERRAYQVLRPVDVAQGKLAQLKIICRNCGQTMRFDSIPEEYFLFLRHSDPNFAL